MLPTIAISMGDPAGVGPEVTVKAFYHLTFPLDYHLFVIGTEEIIEREIEKLQLPMRVSVIQDITQIENQPNEIPLYPISQKLEQAISYGSPSKISGDLSFRSVTKGIDFGQTGRINAIVTAPISKEAWHMAGHTYDGHTGLLAQKTGTKEYRMMFASNPLNVILVTTHLSLRNACDAITTTNILKTIELSNDYLKKTGITPPKIAVCGLNPHASENGIFGTEEKEIIAPAIQQARRNGIDVDGPFPSDTIFIKALSKEYRMVVALYHDQGLIPVKLVAFDKAVNTTLGLPFIRTSVDHGTAFDIAGKGIAKHENMIAAIQHAIAQTRY